MAAYRVDKTVLEAHSTEDILRILREEREDYTPEALEIFQEILDSRGVGIGKTATASSSPRGASAGNPGHPGGVRIHSPGDAVPVLNDLLNRVLNGSVTPEVGQVAVTIVATLLRALEQEYMTGSEEGT